MKHPTPIYRHPSPRTLAASVCASGLVFLGTSMTRPLVPVLLERWGATESTVGFLAGLYALLPLMLAIPSGSWVDRVGPGRASLAGSLGVGVALLAVAVAPSVPSVALSQLLAGQGQLLVVLSTQAASVAGVSGRQLERSVGLLLMSTAAVRMVGPALGGAIAGRWGITPVFFVGGLLTLLGIGPSLLLDRGSGRAGVFHYREDVLTRPALGGLGRALQWVRRDPVMQATFIVTVGVLLGDAVRQVFLPLHLTARGYGPELVGVVASASGLGNLMARPLLSHLTALFGGRWPLAVGTLVAGGLVTGTVPYASGAAVYGLLSFLSGAASGIWPALATVVLAERYPKSEQGLALSVRLCANQVAELAGPAVLGVVASAWGLPLVFWGTAVVSGVLALAVGRRMLVAPRIEPQGSVEAASDRQNAAR